MSTSAIGLLACVAAPTVAQATVVISDPRVTEGDGPTAMTFVVTRSPGAIVIAPSITIGFQTSDATAKAPGDYSASQGSLTFPRGNVLGTRQVQTITVPIAGDTIFEPTEAFTVTLSGSQELVKPTGVGTIFDDDPRFTAPPGRTISMKAASQQLISRTAGGAPPNAPVFDPTISGDSRIARYVAYSSAATNLAAGAGGGQRNVLLVKRGGSPGALGTPWQYGSTKLVSRGRGGPANGDSFGPSLGGWTRGDAAKKPRCMAFVSQASNLVAGDGNGRPDAFTRRLPSGKLKRVKAPAAVSEVAVSGDCRTIVFVAGGSLYAKPSGKSRRRLVVGGASSPSLTFNGAQVGYARNGTVFVRRVSGGGVKTIANGSNPSVDADAPKGKVRRLAYQRGGATYIKPVGGGEKLMANGSSLPVMSGGATQALFAAGPLAYLYAVSNSFGKGAPQGFCPPDQGVINGLDLSARGNYSVLSCTGGSAYLFFLGGK